MDTITVLIPTWNRSKFIYQCLSSIQGQTYKNFKILLYDDGSSDGTPDFVESLKSSIITVIRGKSNKGVSHARNALLDAVGTKYACWQDSDDLSNIHRLALQYDLIKKGDAGIVYGSWASLKDLKAYKLQPLIGRKRIAFATALFDTSEKIYFDTAKNLGGEDVKWMSGMKKLYGPPLSVGTVIYYVRFHGSRIGSMKRKPSEWRTRMLKSNKDKIIGDKL